MVHSRVDQARSPLPPVLPLLIRGTIWREGLGQRLATRCQLALKARFCDRSDSLRTKPNERSRCWPCAYCTTRMRMVCSPHVGPQITYCLFAQQPRGFLLLDFLDMTHTPYVNTAPAVMLCLYPYYLSTFLMHLFFMYTIHAPHESAIWKICVHA